jgi:hypothetical protein
LHLLGALPQKIQPEIEMADEVWFVLSVNRFALHRP